MKKTIYQLSVFTMLTSSVLAQDVLVVDGGNIHVTSNGLITVKGGVINQNSGEIDNSGSINLTGNWTNNGGNTMLINNSGGAVVFDGDDQEIKGTDITDFHNLRLEGAGTVKSMLLDVNVSNELDLDEAELQTHSNTMFVNNPSPSAIVWSGGYVNSDSLGGQLVRTTNSTDKYIFPVGTSLIADTYRPVTITPQSANTNSFGVRLTDLDPNLDNTGTSAGGATGPFSTNAKDAEIRNINTNFYYNIAQLSGTDAADVQVDFFNSDGSFQTLAQWDGSKWAKKDFQFAPSSAGADVNSPDIELKKVSNIDYNEDVFALAELEFEIEVPGGVSANADGFNDALVIENLEFYPENELIIFNRWGDAVFSASPYQNDWTGQVNGSMILVGEEVSDGTYFYILKLSPDESEEPLKGSFELRRK